MNLPVIPDTSGFKILTGPESGTADDSLSYSPPCPADHVAVRCEAVPDEISDGSEMYDGRCRARKRAFKPGGIVVRVVLKRYRMRRSV